MSNFSFFFQFLDKIKDVENKIEELESIMPDLQNFYEQALQSQEIKSSVTKSLNDINDQFTILVKKTNSALMPIILDIESFKVSSSVNSRIKQNQAVNLTKRLCDILIEFNEKQIRYRKICIESLRQHLHSGKYFSDSSRSKNYF